MKSSRFQVWTARWVTHGPMICRACLALWIGLVGVGGGACGTTNSSSGGQIGEIHLFAVPVALNLDSRPGPDGIGVRIYGCRLGKARGIAIQEGRLRIEMFDGPMTSAELARLKPLRVWSFEAAELERFVATTAIGVGYQIALNWGDDRPKSKVVSVLARYRSQSGTELVSTSNTISVGVQ